ncbi:GNAT family N-acetyltransferase [Microbacterium invictum]|uniref:GNAT family N-acetyltransferase n=1 Tax=Microbacterium invictum TaxID=515415 RepID=A0ABZ0VAQ9_9MICO|nr:GNAT family N-acetyltransferase [Microbacterium invictum]WQB70722.1 GNAT family N-acetyltransferase [Microbacterium invictum]
MNMQDDAGAPYVAAAPARPWTRIEATHDTVLRRPTVADVPGIFVVHSDPEVYRFDPRETHPDPAHTAQFLNPMLTHWDEYGFGYWSVLVPRTVFPGGVAAVGDADDGRVLAGLGGVQHHTMTGQPVLNVYFRFAPAAQGHGLARIVLEHVVSIGPLVAPGADVVVRTRPANVIARHVAERAGFVDEGLEPGTTDMQLLRYQVPRRHRETVSHPPVSGP